MDVQMPVTPTTPTASSSQAGKANASDSAAAAQGTGSSPAFTKVLQGQMQQTGTDDAEGAADPALTLAGLLQMLQALTMPMQQAAASDDAKGEGEALPEMLLQAMNSTPGLAEKLLQDPNMQQWFAQAQELLAALNMTNVNGAVAITRTTDASGANTSVLAAQQTLLTLTSMLKQQPDNPVLQYLTQNLQQAVQPMLPELVESFAPLMKAALSQEPVSETPAPSADADVKPQGETVKTSTVHAAHRHAAAKEAAAQPSKDNVVVEAGTTNAKNPLEALASRSGLQPSASSDKQEQVEAVTVAPEAASTDVNVATTVVNVGEAPKTVTIHEMMKTPPQPIQASQFAQDMTQHVMKNMKITLAEGFSEAKLSLFPKNLGHVDVKITMHEGQLIAQFAADTLAGKQMLESQLPQLRQALQSQGLQVEKLEVTQNQNMQSSMFQDQRHQQPSGQTFRQNKNRSGNYDQEADFVQEIAGATEARTTVYGNSFDVTA